MSDDIMELFLGGPHDDSDRVRWISSMVEANMERATIDDSFVEGYDRILDLSQHSILDEIYEFDSYMEYAKRHAKRAKK